MVVAVLGTMALGGLGALLVWFVRRTRRRWKESEYEGVGPSKWRDLGFLVPLVSLFSNWGARPQGDEEDGDEDAETRPLLE